MMWGSLGYYLLMKRMKYGLRYAHPARNCIYRSEENLDDLLSRFKSGSWAAALQIVRG
jgi:hypothetical protein